MILNDEFANELKNKIGVGDFKLPLICEKPIDIKKLVNNYFYNQNQLINSFYKMVSKIARDALKNSDTELLHILFSEKQLGMDLNFYKSIPDYCWNVPLFFRTDQSLSGKIFEIQAPGSGWGDIPLIYNLFHDSYLNNKANMFVDDYVGALKSIANKEYPSVAYFEDAASNPTSIKYIKAITSNKIRYWGLSKDLKMDEVDIVVTHSVNSVYGLNCFEQYDSLAKSGKLHFILPPNLLYDQKAIYVLPFLNKTKYLFTDEVRDMFPFTSYIHDGGFELPDGTFITIEDFSKLSPSKRHYYLKYGGPNVSKNWGSRTIYRLNKNDCFELLKNANECSRKGEIWIIQNEISEKGQPALIKCMSDDIKGIVKDNFHVKISAFHVPNKIIGYKVMYRKHFKVHGQEDTFVGVGLW